MSVVIHEQSRTVFSDEEKSNKPNFLSNDNKRYILYNTLFYGVFTVVKWTCSHGFKMVHCKKYKINLNV